MNEFNANEARESILAAMAYILPTEKFQQLKLMVDSMSDDDLRELAEFSATRDYPIKNPQELKGAMDKLREGFGTTVDNCALNIFKAKMLPDDEKEKIIEKISKSHPSDEFNLNHQADHEIINLWEKDRKKNSNGEMGIPSDLFFSKNIPMMDCNITCDEKDTENGGIIPFRVIIFDDYKNTINKMSIEDIPESHTVGALIWYVNTTGQFDGPRVIISLDIRQGLDTMVTKGVCLHKFPPEREELIRNNVSQQVILNILMSCMETWYGIQIALLHPTVKSVVSKSHRTVFQEHASSSHSNKKRKVRYIKRHLINSNINDTLYEKVHGEYIRRALAWYVIGHWRTYSSGKKVFIEGYWKGALKDTKKNHDEGRIREIGINDDDNSENK